MKAAQFHKTGSPDVIKYEDLPDPKPEAGEVIVRVKAAAMNRLDVFLRSGASSMPGFKMPHIGGFDMAGVVESVGPGVDGNHVGREVVVNARVTGPQARGKLDVIGISRPGGFAERVAVPVQCLATKPKHYTWEEAAAFGCVYLTAYYGLILQARVKPGEIVLVHAGGGGAGTAAIQVAKAAGATVITTAGSDEKCAKAREVLKADHAINYKTADFVDAVKKLTEGRGVDVCFDPVWGPTATKTQDALGHRGRWIVLGMVGGLHASLDSSKLLFKEITLRGIVEFYSDESEIAGAWSLAHRGLVRPIISKTWPLAQLAEAHRQMESGEVFGKIVVVH
jgi:NADPH:quinone reductase-like Zn-dependent oxidoreductase